VLSILEAWMNKRKQLLNGKDEDALFISNQRKRIGNTTVYDIVKKYSSNIKEKKISPHKLRATYGTHLYNETRDIKFVQDQMGHSNPKTTELYIRGNQEADRRKAADIMSSFLKN
jgi:site-specific recombinase XerD